MARAFIDLHCHTRASFDCLSKPADVVRLAAQRGLTHIAITDHDRIDGALEAQAAAPDGLTVIVGEEVKTTDGDLICVFLHGGHPARPDAGRDDRGGPGAGRAGRDPAPVRYVPRIPVAWRPAGRDRAARGLDRGPQRQARRSRQRAGRRRSPPSTRGRSSPSRTPTPSSRSASRTRRSTGDPSTPEALLAALASGELVPGRATYFARLLTPVSKVVQRVRGNGRSPARRRAGTAAGAAPVSGPTDGQDHRPMADGATGPVGSDPMESTPAIDDAHGRPARSPWSPCPEIDESDVAPVSLARRLRQPRTILSIVVPLAIIGSSCT